MNIQVYPSKIAGNLSVPPSKSAMQRAVALALLTKGTSTLSNISDSDDCLAALSVAQNLGAKIHTKGNLVEIIGSPPPINLAASLTIEVGESGLGVRMFTPIAALWEQKIHINGKGSLLKRPLHIFDEIMPQLGIKWQSKEGKLPISLQGAMQARNITLDGSMSSQYLTGYLIAFAFLAQKNKDGNFPSIKVTNLKSKPYIDLTLALLQEFGVEVKHENYAVFHFPTQQSLKPIHYKVEGDWSGAAFLIVAAMVAGKNSCIFSHLDLHSTQSDKAILEVLPKNAWEIKDNKMYVYPHSNIPPFHFDATECPDLFPPLVALAANIQGTSIIKGVSRLQHKESSRAETLQKEFAKLNIEIKLKGDEMFVIGGTNIKGGQTLSSHHDHRIAMSCAVAALNASESVIIEGAEAVNKSYPHFWEDMQSLGTVISEQ